MQKEELGAMWNRKQQQLKIQLGLSGKQLENHKKYKLAYPLAL